MTVKIGWTPRSRERDSGVGGGVRLFELLKMDTDEGRAKLKLVGVLTLNREDLLRLKKRGVILDVDVVGVLRFAADVTPDLIEATIGKRRVIGIA